MRYILIVLCLMGTQSALADGYLRLGGMYITDSRGTEGSMSDTSRTLMDIGAGYVWPKGWTLGLLYGTEKQKSGSVSTDRTSMGPTLGWISSGESGPYLLGTYFLQAEYESFDGTGYQIDLGYKFSIRKISLAPQLSYKVFEYNKAGGQTLSPKYVTKNLDPYFVLWIEF